MDQCFIIHIDVHIGDHRLARADLGYPIQRLGQMCVAGMGCAAQSVYDPQIQPLQLRPCGSGNMLHIGQIGHIVDPKPQRID